MRYLKVIIPALVFVMLCSVAQAKTKEGKLKPILSCDTYSLRDYFGSGKIDYLTAPMFIKGIVGINGAAVSSNGKVIAGNLPIQGICYNSIWMKSYDTAYLDSIKTACKNAGMKITGFIIEGNIATLDDEARKNQIAEDIKQLKAAAYLGAPIVRINLGGVGDDAQDDTVGVQRCIDAFNQILPIAKELNVKITIENHGGVSKTADRILKVIKGTDPKWVGACLDFGNWPNEVRNSESAKLAPYAYHVHAKCRNFTPDGEEKDMDYKYLLGLLKDNHYKYAVSIEYEGGEDQVEGVKKTALLIEKYWPELGQ